MLGNHSPGRIKVWRDYVYYIGLFSLGQVLLWCFCVFVSSTFIIGPVRCDGCGSLLFITDFLRDKVEQVRASLWYCHRVFCLPQHHLFSRILNFLEPQIFFHLLVLVVRPSPWKSVWCVVDGDNWKMMFDFYSVNCLVWWFTGESSTELEKLGETWWNPWLSAIIKLFRAWLPSPLIIRPVTSPLWTLIIMISDTS